MLKRQAQKMNEMENKNAVLEKRVGKNESVIQELAGMPYYYQTSEYFIPQG